MKQLIMHATAILGVATFGAGGLYYLGAQSKHAGAARTITVIDGDKEEQRETSAVFKAMTEKARREEVEAQNAKDLAYSQTPQARALEALRQEDLRALHGSP